MKSLVKRLLGALTHLATLLLQTAGALLLPLPAELGARFLVGVGLVTHGVKYPVLFLPVE